MFDFSWGELIIVAIVGLLLIGPEDLPSVIRTVKKAIQKAKGLGKEFTSQIDEMVDVVDVKGAAQKINEDLKTIVDLEGNIQPTYDISDFTGDKENPRDDSPSAEPKTSD